MIAFSVIIPVLNEGDQIAFCLQRIKRVCPGNTELIVVDGGSSDETVSIAESLADMLITAPRGRASQMNAGAKVASGDVLLFLHADTLLPEGFFQQLSQLDSQSWGWGFCAVQLSGRHWLLRCIERAMNLRSRLRRIGTGDQCLFVKQGLFYSVGGFPSQQLMEDVELCKRLKKTGRYTFLKNPVTTSSRRWEENGITRTVLQMWALRFAYFLGVSANRLADIYYPGSNIASSGQTVYRYPDSCIIQFAKAPVVGKVKTRLQPVLGERGSLALHQALLEHQLRQQQSARIAPLELWFNEFEPDRDGQGACSRKPSVENRSDMYFHKLVLGSETRLGLQKGDSLGDRMRNCFFNRLAVCKNVILIGSDCPAINGEYIAQAIDALDAGSDAVLGPALDGGYVLIGLGKLSAEQIASVFAEVDWGTDSVMEKTRQNLRDAGLRWHELKTLQDIDRKEDLFELEPYFNLQDLLHSKVAVS
ncbi:MAG: TIGR04283 family arsenosugar biosynthesis glycosyltransferase [Porticoccaceae bacterium]|nr:TIGR04283 family arsenosugar biosynthesis glycosyltransferase [Pseudomonadales bacterium]MCP5172001.1 TIGR04283 family arsenosugar biosynthesis glycosyltransferase [Pseudomonadales bacterium]